MSYIIFSELLNLLFIHYTPNTNTVTVYLLIILHNSIQRNTFFIFLTVKHHMKTQNAVDKMYILLKYLFY